MYTVVRRRNNMQGYKVKPEDGVGPTRTLRRDLLLPCRYDPSPVAPNPPAKQRDPVRTRHRSSRADPQPTPVTDSNSDTESESDEPVRYDRVSGFQPPEGTTGTKRPKPSVTVELTPDPVPPQEDEPLEEESEDETDLLDSVPEEPGQKGDGGDGSPVSDSQQPVETSQTDPPQQEPEPQEAPCQRPVRQRQPI